LDFVKYLENPIDFRPGITLKNKVVRLKSRVPARAAEEGGGGGGPRDKSQATEIATSTLPIPIRADLTVLVHGLPYDLTSEEAEKVANVIRAFGTG
jgi:hypothetical protein